MFVCVNEPCRPKDELGLVLIAAAPVLTVVWIALVSVIVAIRFRIVLHVSCYLLSVMSFILSWFTLQRQKMSLRVLVFCFMR